MPAYDFRCDKCDHVFEAFYKMAERDTPTQEPCPNCKETGCVQQIIGGAALISPFRLDGLVKPQADFRERMKQIKSGLAQSGKKNVKDY